MGAAFFDDEIPVAPVEAKSKNPFEEERRGGLEEGGGGRRAVVVVEAEVDLRGGGARKGLAGADGRGGGRGSPKVIASGEIWDPEKKESGDFGFRRSFLPPSCFPPDLREGMKDIPRFNDRPCVEKV